MARYRTADGEVDAVYWGAPDEMNEVLAFLGCAPQEGRIGTGIRYESYRGPVDFLIGDWIVKDADNLFSRVSPEDFARNYEAVN